MGLILNPSTEKLFISASDYFKEVLNGIKQAKESLLFEVYIFDIDSLGLEFLSEIESAHKRGVKIHFLVDGVGSRSSLNYLIKWSEKTQVPFKIYHPYSLLTFWRANTSLNKRNHRKLILIDRKFVYLGSFNISQIHYSWNDVGAFVRVNSFESYQIERAFLRAWLPLFKKIFNKDYSLKKIHPLSRIVFNDSLRSRFRLSQYLLKKIKRSKERIIITTPYFIPLPSIIQALKRASRRGVDVVLILPQKSDHFFFKYLSRTLYASLIKRGIKIFEYRKSILHAKSFFVDDKLIIGSLNWNHRSFLHDLEVTIELSDSQVISSFQSEFERIKNASHLILKSDIKKENLFSKLYGKILYWFRHWL